MKSPPDTSHPSEPEAGAQKPIVTVRDLTRSFGSVEAVRGISFQIYPGQVVGFIGANGAGKTTTMRMMVTLELPNSGTISVDGFDVTEHPGEVRRRIGWMPDAYGAYANMTVGEYLDFFARAFHFRGVERERRIREVMEFADLQPIADRLVNKLSKGMGQRLCLGRTLLHDPPVMILDEPAAGLDPKARIEFKRLVHLLAEEGKTIFISSHILSELGEMCDTLLFIDEGKIVHHGSADELLNSNQRVSVAVQVAGNPEALTEWVALQPGVELFEVKRDGAILTLASAEPAEVAALLRQMVEAGIAVTEFRRESRRLEEAFVELLSQLNVPPPLPES